MVSLAAGAGATGFNLIVCRLTANSKSKWDLPKLAVGGLSVPQAIQTLEMGAEIVVFGAPLVISGQEFKAADPNFDRQLRDIVKAVRGA